MSFIRKQQIQNKPVSITFDNVPENRISEFESYMLKIAKSFTIDEIRLFAEKVASNSAIKTMALFHLKKL